MSDPPTADNRADGDPSDPYDRRRLGYSLSNNRELIFGCLEAADTKSVVEVGAQHGAFTRELLAWAGDGTRITAIDPLPQPELEELASTESRLNLARATSLVAIPELDRFDAYIIDGDHNYFTVSEELLAIEEVSPRSLPLVLFHDVCWPHARRDSYYAPERIPEEHRQPLAENIRLVPWGDGWDTDIGIEYPVVAAADGGPKNGVLTAIEDFLETRPELQLARIPAFFGLAVIWPAAATWADAVAALVMPLSNHPVLRAP